MSEHLTSKTKGETSHTQKDSRRNAMKKLLAASGVVAGSQVVSSEWARPIVQSVVLPAHAITSIIPAGVSNTGNFAIASLFLGSQQDVAKSDNQNDLLDMLLPEANAAHAAVTSQCGFPNSGSDTYYMNISVNIPAGSTPKSVDVCIENFTTNTGLCRQMSTTTMAADNTLGDVAQEQLDQGTLNGSHDVTLSGMTVAADGSVSGVMTFTDAHANGNCFGPFTTIAGGTFSCTLDCNGQTPPPP